MLCRVRCGSPVGGRNIAESSAKKIINIENNVYSKSGIIEVYMLYKGGESGSPCLKPLCNVVC